jgi:hypothetical protein
MFIKNLICNQSLSTLHARIHRKTYSKVTKPKYIQVLSIIGRSPRPLTKYRIEEAFAKERGKSKQRHIYRMIRSLSGEDNYHAEGPVDPLKFLDITLKEKCLELIHELDLKYNEKLDYNWERINEGQRIIWASFDLTDEKEKAIREIVSLWENPENRRYSLNIRGFMLFIYGESRSNVQGKRTRIREVIQNPAIINNMPFLKYWQDFQEVGFDVFNELELLAKELEGDILDPNVTNYRIMLRVIDRYYISIINYLRSLEYGTMLDPNKYRERFMKAVELQIWTKKLKEFSLPLLQMQKELLNEQIASIDREYKRHSS